MGAPHSGPEPPLKLCGVHIRSEISRPEQWLQQQAAQRVYVGERLALRVTPTELPHGPAAEPNGRKTLRHTGQPNVYGGIGHEGGGNR
jgi:hypothetical protein